MRTSLCLVLAACGGAATAPAPIGNTTPARAAVGAATSFYVLEPAPDGCALRLIAPTQPTVELALIPDRCTGGRIARHPTGRELLVWFDPALTEGASGNLYEVEAGTTTKLAAWRGPDPLAFVGYGADGSTLAFATHDLPDATGVVRYLDHALDFADLGDGMPAAAVTYRLVGTRWQLVAVERTTTGWDYAQGYTAAALAPTTTPDSFTTLDGHFETRAITEGAVRAQLAALEPTVQPDTNDGWQALTIGKQTLYVFIITGELQYTTAALAWRTPTGVERLPEGPRGEVREVAALARLSDRYLLVAAGQTGASPRVYDLVSRRVVYRSDTAVAAFPTRS